MSNKNNIPVLITITAPSAGGKTFLYNYIRDVAKLPCLVSTTTRAPRANEVNGVDYYFITEEESMRLEATDSLAELAIYRGVRYGVTKHEFMSKLSNGIAFLIVEPSGIDHYVKPALEAGALHLNVYLDTPLDVRLARFKERAAADALLAAMTMSPEKVYKTSDTYMDRLHAILTEEMTWPTICEWDQIISGLDTPEDNLKAILEGVDNLRDGASL
jgi:guanylate kinase